MGSKGNQVKTKQTYTPDPAVYNAGQEAISMGQSAANLPFNIPQQPIAGFTPDQLQAFQQIRGMQGMTNPYFAAAGNYMNQSAQPISASDVSQYYNPMASNVFGQMSNIFGQQRAANTGALTQQAGGVGADRIAVGQSELANQQGLAAGQTAAGLYQQALTAAQQNKQMQMGAGYGLGQLGPAAQNASLQATGALGQAGSVQQQLAQAYLNAPYAQQLQQAQYPYSQAQFLAGITGSLAGAMGGTTQGVTTYPTPSPLSQALGVGTALMGFGGMGGFGSMGGKGSTGGGYPTAGYNGQAGSYMPWGSQTAPGGFVFNYNRGGAVDPIDDDWRDDTYASGGLVNPYDTMKGFAEGGANDRIYEENEFSPIDANATYGEQDYSPLDAAATANDNRPLYAENEFSPLDAKAAPQDYPSKEDFISGLQKTYGPFFSQSAANAAPAMPGINAPQLPGPNQLNNLYPPGPANAAFQRPPAPPVAPSAPLVPAGAQRTPSMASAMPQQPAQNPYMMPDSARPYPGARQNDWGQQAARSPWMSLVRAGATMANSIGPIGSVIGKGIEAGANTLDSQRKSLQNEEQINQKAQSLYTQAKHYLDQYTKMTPYQRQSIGLAQQRLDREKYTPVNYETADGKVVAASYDPKTGTYRGEDGAPLTGGKIIARQSGAESATSRANAAFRQAKDDPNYYSDQLGTINKWRGQNGLPPLAANEVGGTSAATATPDPGADKRIQGNWYIVNGVARQWNGTGG